jgi:cobalt-zinc-cadmium efflux system membrane fusion protein
MTLKNTTNFKKRFAWIAGIALCSLSAAVGCNGKGSAARVEGEQASSGKEYEKGPHGGRLLTDEKFQAEITIYERGVPPQFRVYFYDKGKPVRPQGITLRIELHRLGGQVDLIGFRPEGDYLIGDKVAEEPHSFDVRIAAEREGTNHTWRYSQTEGRVELSEEAVRTSAITIETAGPREMRSVLELPGEITFNGDKVAHVVPRMPGVIREIRKNQGDAVKKGEVVAILESRELAEAKRHFLETSQELDFARKVFEREEGLWKKNISSGADYLAAERAYQGARLKHQSARQQLEALGIGSGALRALREPNSTLTRYELRAPFDGVLIEKKVAAGQAVTEDEDLFTIADLSTVWVNVTVYAKDLNAVKVGQEVTVRSDTLGIEAPGRIVYLGSLVGEATRSAVARVVLPDLEGRWRPGLFVNVEVVREEVTVPVAVRREALQKFRDWDVVFIRVGKLFEARPLELGRTNAEFVEVLSGLKPGEKYAAANSFILKADVGKAGASHDH